MDRIRDQIRNQHPFFVKNKWEYGIILWKEQGSTIQLLVLKLTIYIFTYIYTHTVLYIALIFTPGNIRFYFTSRKAGWAAKLQEFQLLSLSPVDITRGTILTGGGTLQIGRCCPLNTTEQPGTCCVLQGGMCWAVQSGIPCGTTVVTVYEMGTAPWWICSKNTLYEVSCYKGFEQSWHDRKNAFT